METIINYLDNMFATLPKTKQMKGLREDLLSNMEDKYNELKGKGKSENEAIGIVISEFGNIDELMNEFNIQPKNESIGLPRLSEDEVNAYLEVSKKTSIFSAIGGFLCLIGVAIFILIPQLIEDGFITGLSVSNSNVVALVPLFLFVAIATGIFIYAGIAIDKYKYMENSFELPAHVRKSIEIKYDSFNPTYMIALIIGVMMCILSPIGLFTMSVINNIAIRYGVVALLLTISVAVYILIYFTSIQVSYKKILKIEEYSKSNKAIGAASAIVWPLAVAIFLISGLVYHKWYINWIVFPVAGLLLAMFSGAYRIMKERN